jgi:hypothetical protein
MELSGPFFIRGRATRTGFDLAPGDRLIVLASGVLKARLPGQAVQEVTADGIPIPAADSNWPAPGLETLSLITRVGDERSAMRAGIKIVAPVLTAPLSSDVITLDVNAPPGTEFAPGTGFSVYVVKVPAGQTPPRLRNWVSFRDLTAAPTSIQGGIAAALLGDVIHVFYPQDDAIGPKLKHLTIDADGTIGPTDDVDSELLVPPDNWFGTYFTKISALVHRGTVNVFYCVQRSGALGVLRRAELNSAGAWGANDVDGDERAGTIGQIYAVVGPYNGAVSVGNTLHVLSHAPMDTYVSPPGEGFFTILSNSPLDVLRHARFDVGSPWRASTIDGTGGPAGRVAGETGEGVSVMLDTASQVHAFYYLGDLADGSDALDLRHAELAWTGGNNQTWRFETLDGAGRTFANATGQVRWSVGRGIGCMLHKGELHVAYNDNLNRNLRHGVKPQGSGWSFETLDGNTHTYIPDARYGPSRRRVRPAPKAMVSVGDQISIFYEYEGANQNVLRHAFKRTGLPWMFETVDGDVAYGGRVRSTVQTPAAVVRDGFVNLIYYDAGRSRLRHAVLSQ